MKRRSMAMTAVGLIGLGLLGSAIAERLIADGHQVTGFDINPERRTAHLDPGGRLVDDVLELCRSHKILMLSLPDSRIVAGVLSPVMNDLHGHLIVDTTTVEPQDVRALAVELASRNSSLLDATVVGSSEQTRRAEVTVIAGGSESAFQSALPLLKLFTATVSRRSVRKRCHGKADCEPCSRTEPRCACGSPEPDSAMRHGSASTAGDPPQRRRVFELMDIKGEKMVTQDFTPQARLDQHWKDVRLILELGQATGSQLPLSQLHAQLLEMRVEPWIRTARQQCHHQSV